MVFKDDKEEEEFDILQKSLLSKVYAFAAAQEVLIFEICTVAALDVTVVVVEQLLLLTGEICGSVVVLGDGVDDGSL